VSEQPKIAETLDDLYRVCDPEMPLANDDPRYVDLSEVRGMKNLAKSLARQIRRADRAYLQKLVTGHRGSGKSTELLRLKAQLEHDGFFTIYLDVEDLLDLVEIDYLDVLLVIARVVEQASREAGFKLPYDLLDDLYEWFADKVIETDERQALTSQLKTQAEGKLEIPLIAHLLARFTGEIQTASSRRVNTRHQLARELPVFISKLNVLLGAVRTQAQKADFTDIVVIVDGLEKMHYNLLGEDKTSTHANLFLHHAEQLKAPECHIIYTVPMSLAFNANLHDVFDMVVLPMVKTDQEGLDKLKQIIAVRADVDNLFTHPAHLNELLRVSGGVVRDLMHLIRLASDTDEAQIGQEEVLYAINTLSKDYDRTLRNLDLEALRFVHENQRIPADEKFERLLNLRIILEYGSDDDERPGKLHPAVERINWLKNTLSQAANPND